MTRLKRAIGIRPTATEQEARASKKAAQREVTERLDRQRARVLALSTQVDAQSTTKLRRN